MLKPKGFVLRVFVFPTSFVLGILLRVFLLGQRFYSFGFFRLWRQIPRGLHLGFLRRLKTAASPTGSYRGSTARHSFFEATQGLRSAVVNVTVQTNYKG